MSQHAMVIDPRELKMKMRGHNVSSLKARVAVAVLVLLNAVFGASYAQAQEAPLEAVTQSGEKVRLFPNGRWEYANTRKAEVQRQAVEADLARERASQGGFLGIGRRIYPGDKEYNRGTLNPKMH